MPTTVQDLMDQTGVRFGTSGARGLATQLTDQVANAYTQGFLGFLKEAGELNPQRPQVLVAGDLRPSTPRIANAVLQAVADFGLKPVHCGCIPSPALALEGFLQGVPTIMVTGSHIPDDRNGIKFNKVSGEVLKQDEPRIAAQIVPLNPSHFTPDGASTRPPLGLPIDATAITHYLDRYPAAFGPQALSGLHLGVYQHSAVGRDVLVALLQSLGATVTPLGRSDRFIPVDTEAIRPEDTELALSWAATGRFDAIVSADGDSDRPLIADEQGRWIRGDVAGILCAKFLGADSVSTPVSCNTALERTGWFPEIHRTRIGSPFVVASMLAAAKTGRKVVVGYEANGGFLLQTPVTLGHGTLAPLPTRDAALVAVALLRTAKTRGIPLSQLVGELPPRYTASRLLKNCPITTSQAILAKLNTGSPESDADAFSHLFGPAIGQVQSWDRTDGLRATLDNQSIVHLRPSGNAPEFRCYTEAESSERAETLCEHCLHALQTLANPPVS